MATQQPQRKPVLDRLGRPLHEGATVEILASGERGTVIDRTANRRTMVNVQRADGRITAFYGSSLWLS
jgi:hypothetical protein